MSVQGKQVTILDRIVGANGLQCPAHGYLMMKTMFLMAGNRILMLTRRLQLQQRRRSSAASGAPIETLLMMMNFGFLSLNFRLSFCYFRRTSSCPRTQGCWSCCWPALICSASDVINPITGLVLQTLDQGSFWPSIPTTFSYPLWPQVLMVRMCCHNCRRHC